MVLQNDEYRIEGDGIWISKKAQENFFAGGKAVIREIHEAYKIGGIDAVVQRINSFIEEIKR